MRDRDDRGSALLLVPAGVLVLVVLGSIAVDFALAFLGQRELSDAAAAAANDAAAAAIADIDFYRAGAITLDSAAAARVAADSITRRAMRGVTVVAPPQVATSGPQVCVTVTGRVDYLFARAVPGMARSVVVHGRASAVALEGGAGVAVPKPSC
ncbi:MAG: hypothetical protein LC792_17485 [Actinobacteria bacterium]|nr:hypothetical protein [Actinomycetota bacterium]